MIGVGFKILGRTPVPKLPPSSPPPTPRDANQTGAFVYRNGLEWAELPEWTTGMDFNMQPLVLLLYFICLELPIVFTERSFNEKDAV